MFQRALICTDFSDGLYRLTQVLPSLVEGGLRHFVFFHNVAVEGDRSIPRVDQEGIESAQQRLEGLLKAVPAEAEVDIQVVSGRPMDNILKLAKAKKVDVALLGMPARTLLTEKLFGSTTMGIVERTPVPLLIMRPQLLAAYTTEELALRCRHLFRHLLVPYNGSDSANSLLDSLQEALADNGDRRLESCALAWVISDASREVLQEEYEVKRAEEQLSVAKVKLEAHGIQVQTMVRRGDTLAELMTLAEELDISAIAAGPSGTGGFMKWSVPSLTRDILRQSWHPVLYLPGFRNQ